MEYQSGLIRALDYAQDIDRPQGSHLRREVVVRYFTAMTSTVRMSGALASRSGAT
jgi:hypothetical protein